MSKRSGKRASKKTPAATKSPATEEVKDEVTKVTEMTQVQKEARVKELLDDLAMKPGRNKEKGIRRQLRELGHRGGLRAVKAAELAAIEDDAE